MKILISGAKGQLVKEIIDLATQQEKIEVHPYSRDVWDITNYDKNREIFELVEPDVYIHGASIHHVADIHKDSRLAAKVNIAATHNLIKLCNEMDNCKFINFSTDYIFSERSFEPLTTKTAFDESSERTPFNLYGVMKYAIEQMLENDCNKWMNIRVCGLFGKYGSRAKNDSNFPLMILDKIKNKEEIKVVDDQIITVGYCKDIAHNIITILNVASGHYHMMNEGILTWYDLASFICNIKGYNNISKVSSTEFYSDFKRAQTTALENKRLPKFPDWRDAIVRFMKEIGEI